MTLNTKNTMRILKISSFFIFTILLFSLSSCKMIKGKNNAVNKNTKQDTITTASGLKYIITEHGRGVKAEKGAVVKVHYIGRLTNDTIFDSSYKRKKPFSFTLGKGQVIKGWDEGISYLHQGDKARLIIPANLGYGNRTKPNIPANSTLIFDVNLIEVQNPIKIEPFNVKGKDTITTASGLKYIIVKKGAPKNTQAQKGDIVTVNYSGYFKNGKMFDSSIKRRKPFKTIVGEGRVIRGWDEGLMLMKTGDKFRFIIPYYLAYGQRKRGAIPAKSDLIFDIEMLKVRKAIDVKPFDTKGKDTITTASGLKIIKIKTTKNKQATKGKIVTVHYTGYLSDGKIFDSSVKRDEPINFPLGVGKVIKGWDEALLMMRKGEKCRLIIPPSLAYGERGAGGVIPPNATLIFDLELINIQ